MAALTLASAFSLAAQDRPRRSRYACRGFAPARTSSIPAHCRSGGIGCSLPLKFVELLLHQAQLLLQCGNLGICSGRLRMRVSKDGRAQRSCYNRDARSKSLNTHVHLLQYCRANAVALGRGIRLSFSRMAHGKTSRESARNCRRNTTCLKFSEFQFGAKFLDCLASVSPCRQRSLAQPTR